MADDMPEAVRVYLREKGERLGKTHGHKGAETTNAKLTTAQRKRAAKKAKKTIAKKGKDWLKQRAQAAAAARWGKKKEKESSANEQS